MTLPILIAILIFILFVKPFNKKDLGEDLKEAVEIAELVE